MEVKFQCLAISSRGRLEVRYTVDGERFAGLNIRGFSAIEVFAEIFSRYLGHKQCISNCNCNCKYKDKGLCLYIQ